jgi:predicted ATPase/DNA-binding winged helix-turn-helix (wHTH) protein
MDSNFSSTQNKRAMIDNAITPPPTAAASPLVAFGPFLLHTEPPRLCRAGEEVRLGGRALALLTALVGRPGEVLSRSELEAQVWPYTVVEDSSLRVHVAALRRALGDGVDGGRYIANVPGRGYCFVAPVEHIAVAPAPADHRPSADAGRINNVPASLVRLFGRETILATLAAELGRRRLVSIVGHGGIGKTSLALAVAARVEHSFADGVCFVDLAPMTAPHHVVETVASALGLPVSSESHIGELESWLAARRLLLVIDNCEHLLDPVAALVDRVLRRAPDLVVLTTSREPLDAEGEWVHRISPLETPPEHASMDSAGALAFSAVQLLHERASASLDTFTIDEGNVHLAAALCRRLDGVPLAIEFAASRIGLLGLQGVCAQLDDRLRLLGSGRRTALPRHRTLRALLDWSYQLLAQPQQEVLRRCGVFKGSFSLEAADVVIADEHLPGAVVRECLFDLAAKSLVRVDLAHAPPSYSLLEITRAYAIEQLSEDPRRQEVYRRHAQFMVRVVKRRASEQSDTLPQHSFLSYASHLGNFRAALEWSFGAEGDPALGIALLGTDFHPMALCLGEHEYRMRAKQALDAINAGVRTDPIYEVRIFSVFHYLAAADGDQSGLDRLLLVAEQEADVEARIEALYQLHAHNFGRGNYQLCERFSRASEVAAQGCGEAEMLHARRLRALSSHYRGEHALAAEYASSLLYHDDQQVHLRLTGWLSRRLSMQILMARIFWMQGQGVRALALAAECVHSAEEARFPAALSQAICLAALPLALWQGDNERALVLLRRLEAHLAAHPQQYWTAWLSELRQLMALRAGPAGPMASLPGAPDAKLLDHLVSFGAWAHHARALARWRDGIVGWSGPELLRVEGELLLRGGRADAADAARAAFAQALALAEQQQAHAWALRARNSLAALQLQQGHPSEAHALLVPCLPRLQAMGDSADAARARALLDQCRPER